MGKIKEKIAHAVDKVVHPGGEEEVQQDQAAVPAQQKPAKSSKVGKADPARDYANHPKFAKFIGEK